jgi:hypothetical protein
MPGDRYKGVIPRRSRAPFFDRTVRQLSRVWQTTDDWAEAGMMTLARAPAIS